MTTEEWRAAVAADRPPLSPEQVAQLRPILAPAVPRIKSAAPTAEAGAAPANPAEPERKLA